MIFCGLPGASVEWAAPPVDVVYVWVSWEGACGQGIWVPTLGKGLRSSRSLSLSMFLVVSTGVGLTLTLVEFVL